MSMSTLLLLVRLRLRSASSSASAAALSFSLPARPKRFLSGLRNDEPGALPTLIGGGRPLPAFLGSLLEEEEGGPDGGGGGGTLAATDVGIGGTPGGGVYVGVESMRATIGYEMSPPERCLSAVRFDDAEVGAPAAAAAEGGAAPTTDMRDVGTGGGAALALREAAKGASEGGDESEGA